ncbi:uncharacterized protein LOC129599326 [Paramacrobiotus metropolitanus]|uniref:uncharacterized protein LOC129599326 n=1 Tax=Paramacrobiotus metropolitanus TaxID=2943436 RepID=UPI0024462EB1|nr:uncharacterized protein LOC129599326 [Paramacrobiotus metropolitanus]
MRVAQKILKEASQEADMWEVRVVNDVDDGEPQLQPASQPKSILRRRPKSRLGCSKSFRGDHGVPKLQDENQTAHDPSSLSENEEAAAPEAPLEEAIDFTDIEAIAFGCVESHNEVSSDDEQQMDAFDDFFGGEFHVASIAEQLGVTMERVRSILMSGPSHEESDTGELSPTPSGHARAEAAEALLSLSGQIGMRHCCKISIPHLPYFFR